MAVEVVTYAPDGTNISLAFKLEFFGINNKAEYEALIIGLASALRMGIRRLLGAGRF